MDIKEKIIEIEKSMQNFFDDINETEFMMSMTEKEIEMHQKALKIYEDVICAKREMLVKLQAEMEELGVNKPILPLPPNEENSCISASN